ncbi:MAG: leucyl/phenylalanyl-tRNA--protein transferase [Hyphomicrobium sp.]
MISATAELAQPAATGQTPASRSGTFRETWSEAAMRNVLGVAYACRPKRIVDLPHLVYHCAADLMRGGTRQPSQSRTWSRPDTFAGLCRNLSPASVLAAARLGFFPWCHCGPLKWWTREERMVLFFDEHHIAKRFRSIMKKSPYRVTFDTAFEEVIRACAEPRQNRRLSLTWITPKIMRLYTALHAAGHAHSVEVWDEQGRLVGGTYGVAVGKVFVTESQFFREPNASKLGYHLLNHHLAKWGFLVNDNKGWTEATSAMGFREIPRSEYEALLRQHAETDHKTGPWRAEDDLATVAAMVKSKTS